MQLELQAAVEQQEIQVISAEMLAIMRLLVLLAP
jgi:hypothetical protein